MSSGSGSCPGSRPILPERGAETAEMGLRAGWWQRCYSTELAALLIIYNFILFTSCGETRGVQKVQHPTVGNLILPPTPGPEASCGCQPSNNIFTATRKETLGRVSLSRKAQCLEIQIPHNVLELWQTETDPQIQFRSCKQDNTVLVSYKLYCSLCPTWYGSSSPTGSAWKAPRWQRLLYRKG